MCEKPVTIFLTKELNPATRKPYVHFTPRLGLDKYTSLQVPCGKCLECRLKKSKMWSLRCVHEAQFHRDNCFITLTYNDINLPTNNGYPTLRYKDVQDFLKRLRKHLDPQGIKFRYFCSSEYGGKKGRPHYHILLFGYKPNDLVPLGQSYSGMLIYKSKEINEIWNKGFCFIGTVTQASAGYVARYTLEKFKSKGKHFYDYREKEAIRMSRRNGIGFSWISKHWRNVSKVGHILLDSVKYSIPRFYLAYIEKVSPEIYSELHQRIVDYAIKKCEELNSKLENGILSVYDLLNRHKYKLYSVKRLKRRLFKNTSHVGYLC